MGLFRLLFWIILIAAVFWLWRRLKKPASTRPGKRTEQASLKMVRCAHCGVHVPEEQALQSHDQWYCSQAHLQQGSKPGGS
ncbi:PP0621 family protein [Stutzerimonas marianensis]|uniref:PP0621 family protein n=1 Tax=Stutzerimonas marianensis TaxID=2929513 RepID=UPI003C2F256F